MGLHFGRSHHGQRGHDGRHHGGVSFAWHGPLYVTPPHRAVYAASADGEPKAAVSRAAVTWMQRLRRVDDMDISVCPRCGGSVKVLAVMTEPDVIASTEQGLRAFGPDRPR